MRNFQKATLPCRTLRFAGIMVGTVIKRYGQRYAVSVLME